MCAWGVLSACAYDSCNIYCTTKVRERGHILSLLGIPKKNPDKSKIGERSTAEVLPLCLFSSLRDGRHDFCLLLSSLDSST